MSNIWIPILAVGGYYLLKHAPTRLALLKLEFAYAAMDIIKVGETVINAAVLIKVTNPSGADLTLDQMESMITLNGKMIGLMKSELNLRVPAKSAEYLKLYVDIEKQKIGAELWQMILNKQTDFNFEILGSVVVNGNKYPVNVDWGIKDLISLIQK